VLLIQRSVTARSGGNSYRALVSTLRDRDHWKYSAVKGSTLVILRRIFSNWDKGMNWIDMAQDRDKWRALVNWGMYFGFP
jgi:hypothetical protein